ncbi:AAA family ATPase [Bradyrhizobium sp. S3.3.6]|uniref:AAA family ATPase n=1 Tax=Bradyrhizobium sp. S3.3.6 TaxID=3156429 RepID=UPI0033999973
MSHGDETTSVLVVLPANEHPAPAVLDRLAHEYELRDELDAAWAARPLEFVREQGQAILLLQDPGGEPLDRLIGPPMGLEVFLRLAVALSVALGRLHGRGLVHKDIKPTSVLVNASADRVWLTGFGIASRLARERQVPVPPEFLEGTLAYMAPEQTGRMNRSIDSRSDLYSLGVMLYQMLTGSLPFTASDPMEWVHCHIARNPTPPGELLRNVPAPVSEILMKLLGKAPEERYQTAAGLEHDLLRCLSKVRDQIDAFPLGERDVPDRLLIPEKLYGREREISALLASFDRSVKRGAPELVLVSGYSGIGKSSVVNELHKVLVPARGLFASGKFDQCKRDIPYSTLSQAFQSLIRPLLGKSDAELAGWREAIREALSRNGRLIIDLVPELKLIVGDQPPVPELPLDDAQRRFQLVFRRFLAVFARPEHPLALFLDDLQWLDSATLDLLEDLLTQPDVRHLMLIGAYRDNEVNSAHPLIRKLETIRKAGAVVHEIILAPLASEDLGRLIGDALHCEPGRVTALAELIHEKTTGNPFFANQLISVLVEEGLLTFDYVEGRWSWDLNRIRAKGYTDNVVDLMVGKLNRLAVETQQALQLLACMGNSAEFALLEMASQQSTEEMHRQLWDAMKAGLIFRTEQSYKFLHDRLQEAAYSLIPQEQRAEIHLRVGRLLASHIPPAKREERIFEIVNQLNRGVALVTSAAERLQIAELNLIAGRRARASTAYKSALVHLVAGEALLSEDHWEQYYGLRFSLALHRAECEFLTGEPLAADERLSRLQLRAIGSTDLAAVVCLRMALYTTDRPDLAVEVGVEQLRAFGIEWSAHPSAEEVRAEYDALRQRVGERPIETLVDLASTKDPDLLALMEVLRGILSPALHTERKLHDLALLRMANLSLEHGYCDGSPLAFAQLSMAFGPHFGHYRDGFRFGHLGAALVEREDLARFRGKVYCVVGYHVLPWTRPIQAASTMVQRALKLAEETGDLLFVAYCQAHLVSLGLASGAPLDDLEVEAERYLQSSRRMRFSLLIEIITTQLALIRTLRGLTAKFGYLVDVHAELRMERHLSGDPPLAIAACWYWIRKMQARYLAGDYAAALDASSEARPLLGISPSHWEAAEFYFYSALSHAAFSNHAGPDEKRQHFEALKAHHDQLEVWAQNCPENFENGAALVGAEIARTEGRALDAEHLYEEAIRSARTTGFIHNEAIAYELAARFYAARGFKQIADLYLRNARYGYLRWGAVGKVRQLDEMYPDLRQEEQLHGPTSTIGAPLEQLDLATVIKVSQAVSGEIAIESLIDALMHIAMGQAGAERALLIVPRGKEPRIEAEATTSGDTVTVRRVDEAATERALPESVLHYVLRTREIVVLDDAAAQSPFGVDSYIRQRRARSILCLPLLNQAKLIGVLYLENNLTPRVFAPARISILKLLASQAAIALENAHLYRDVAEREAKIRRLVDSNIIGILIWDFDGRVLEANDEFLRMVDYNREDLVSGRIRWPDLTPPDWRDRNNARIEQQKSSGRFNPIEKEYTRRDGSRVPVLSGGATFEQGGNQGVAFVVDLTERKRAEQALMRSEAYLAETQKLTHTGSWAWDARSQKVLYCSEEMFRIFGLDPQEDLPTRKTFRQRVHPEDRNRVDERFARVVNKGVDSFDEYRVVLPDGTVKHVSSSGHPVLDGNGELIEFVGTATDVTERKRAEEALRVSEAKFRDYAETASDWLWETDPDHKFMLLTENAFGSDPTQRIGTMCWDHALDVETEPEKWRLVRATLDAHKSFRDFVYCTPDGSGAPMYVKASGKPVFDSSGKFRGYRGTGTDVTAIVRGQRAEASLRTVQAELAHVSRVMTLGQLTASIAHEVNQPIGSARNNARAALNFLDRIPPDLGEVSEALACIVADADRAGGIIDRIRDQIKKAPPRSDRFDLNEAIEEVIGLAQSTIAENRVSVQRRLASGMAPVHGDRVQLQQVVLNLILNAVDAMSSVETDERELLISTDQNEANGTLVGVRDSGPGIDPKRLDLVFEAFYSTKSGMGMGLSICRSIIAAHGGRLWAAATEPRGALFQFTLPSAEAKSSIARPFTMLESRKKTAL